MLSAVCGSSAGTVSCVGTARGLPRLEGRTGSETLRDSEVRPLICALLGNEVESTTGLVVSMRNEESTVEESPGKGGLSGAPMTTTRILLKPSGKLAGACSTKLPDASVIADV